MISQVPASTVHNFALSETCGFRRVYRSCRLCARVFEPARARLLAVMLVPTAPNCDLDQGPCSAVDRMRVISMGNQSLGQVNTVHRHAQLVLSASRPLSVSASSFGVCVKRGKPGSWVMPRGRFAELNSEVDGAVLRRLRRSRTKGVGHREEGDEADAVKRTKESNASDAACDRGVGGSPVAEQRLAPAFGRRPRPTRPAACFRITAQSSPTPRRGRAGRRSRWSVSAIWPVRRSTARRAQSGLRRDQRLLARSSATSRAVMAAHLGQHPQWPVDRGGCGE